MHRRKQVDKQTTTIVDKKISEISTIKSRLFAAGISLLQSASSYSRILAKWWARRDSNPQPSGYEPPALTIELQARALCGRHSEERNGSLVVRKRAVTQKMVVSKRCRNGYTIAVQLSLLFHSFRCKEPILCARQRSGRINVQAGHYNVSADLKS